MSQLKLKMVLLVVIAICIATIITTRTAHATASQILVQGTTLSALEELPISLIPQSPPPPLDSGFSCDWDCTDTVNNPWTYDTISYMFKDGMCEYNTPPTCCGIVAHYRYRTACGQQQLEVLQFQMYNHVCQVGGFDPVPLLKSIVNELLTRNPMGFHPTLTDPDTCMTITRVKQAKCWRNWPTQMYAITCPNGSSCCMGVYTICKWVDDVTGLPVRSYSLAGGHSSSQACPDSCYNSCDGSTTRKKDSGPELAKSVQQAPYEAPEPLQRWLPETGRETIIPDGTNR
jgi:hypothetical protein